jgi:hypothetical protein
MSRKRRLPSEALVDLRRRLGSLPARSAERRSLIHETADLYGISEASIYRLLSDFGKPRSIRRADFGTPRVLPKDALERYCEIIAAAKVKTSNKKGHHLSTAEALRLLESYGFETPDGAVKAPAGVLHVTTVNRYLRRWGYDRNTLARPPPAVRFQAEHSNACWQFDLSPSDLKEIKPPPWVDQGRSGKQMMLYSVVDDRSGVAYMEYHEVYGEDVEAGLRFMFRAMSPKSVEGFPFQGIPEMIYTDNGPIARSHVFQQVMKYLGVTVRTHLPAGRDGRRPTARSKGKVERPFRTVKEMHETLYHFHEPQTEAEANAWLLNFLVRYNGMQHRAEEHSRMEDWLTHLPPSGLREMCSWERFCTFAREPERRKVGIDARVSVNGIPYEVDPSLAGETVILWWGIFDNALYVEQAEKPFGPYYPVGGPIELHRYRAFKKSRSEQRADRIEALAEQLKLPRAALDNRAGIPALAEVSPFTVAPFRDPDPYQEFTFPNRLAAKRAIADFLVKPLAKLSSEQLEQIEAIVNDTLDKKEVIERVKRLMQASEPGERHAK